MDIETLKLNILNVFALSLQMVNIERSIAIAVGVTALVYNCMKIYSWLKRSGKI
jgi:hypothetical protein